MSKYLLKTLCTEVFNAALTSLATDHMLTVTADALESVEVSSNYDKEYPTMHYFRIPIQILAMIVFMFLIVYFWKSQFKIALWVCF